MRQTNRSVYLVGNTLEHFPISKLPSYQQVFQRFYYIHTIDQEKPKESANATARELIEIWKTRANLPTKDENEVSKMIIKLFNEWNNLKTNEHHVLKGKAYTKALNDKDERALAKSSNQQKRRRAFTANFENLFDIASKDAFEKMNVQEDIDFYLSQKKPGRPGCISQSIDRSYSMLLDCSLSDIEEDMECS